jgi:hypothetical protein
MRDFQADWKRWSRFERFSAVVGLSSMIALFPILAASPFVLH